MHIAFFNFFQTNKVASVLNFSTVLSVMGGSLLSYYLFSSQFESADLLLVTITGAAGAAFFALSLYGFMGPVCADRSLSAHMVIILNSAGGVLTKMQLKEKYTQDMVLDKRLEEHHEVGVIKLDSDNIILTTKGRRIAYAYELMIKILKMKKNYQIEKK